VLPLEQSLEGPKVGVEIDDCEAGEDEDEDKDEGVVAITDFDEVSVGLKYISIPQTCTIFPLIHYLVVELWVTVAT
jgi:hypothetical protein